MKLKYILIVALGSLLLWGVAYASICTGYPSFIVPLSMPVAIPILILTSIMKNKPQAIALATSMIPILFICWSYPLFKGQEELPERTKAVAVVLVLLSSVYLMMGLSGGIKYQGTTHTLIVCSFNLVFWLLLFLLYRFNDRRKTFLTNFLFHWMMFAWVGWVAFPWLGELI